MWHRVAVSFWMLILVAACATTGRAEDPGPGSALEREEYDDLLKLFVEVFDNIDRRYVELISRRELMEAAIEGMLEKLDRHSSYVTAPKLEALRRAVDSEFAGIGIEMRLEGGQLTVVSPLADSPASKANLLAGDCITHIDGKATAPLTLGEAVQLIKGKPGSTVQLTIRHPAEETPETIALTRDHVRIRTVRGDRRRADESWDFMYEPEAGIGYVRVTSFSRHTVDELRAAMDQLCERELRGLLLDLRSNPGGLLSSAVGVCDMFVEEGVIVRMSGANIAPREWQAHQAGTWTGFPMVVLVNRFSASASEIVAACLQDHGRAVVAGQRTWGKGSIQSVLAMEQGRSALKLTTAEYYRPNGNGIDRKLGATEQDAWGVTPNVGLEHRLSDSEAGQLERQRQSKDLLRQPPTSGDPIEDRQFDIALRHLHAEVAKAHAVRPAVNGEP